MSKLGSALGKKYEENRLAVLSRSFELGGHIFKVKVPSVAEIETICDHATVLRDGFDVDNFAATSGSEERIVSAMLGDKNNVSNAASRSNYSSNNNEILRHSGLI